MTETLHDRKARVRHEAAERRKLAHRGAEGAAEAARDHVLSAAMHRGAGIASGYRPIRSEIDPTPLMLSLADAGLRLCVPVIEAKGRPLRFREWGPQSGMERGPFGAMVPSSGAWLEPDLLIVPLLAFDADCRRLGYGGGFYDRTLARLRSGGRVCAIGLAYAAQEVAEVPADATDQRLDAVATEAGMVWQRGAE